MDQYQTYDESKLDFKPDDFGALNLSKAIRQKESSGLQGNPYEAKGASGEFGAYQYTQNKWDELSAVS